MGRWNGAIGVVEDFVPKEDKVPMHAVGKHREIISRGNEDNNKEIRKVFQEYFKSW